jgi:NAD+ synthase (glutamine-hydrolysing)
MRIALAQVNATVGDLAGNAELIVSWTRRAAEQGASLVVFPEMVLTGYPVEDLALRSSFVEASVATLHETASRLAADGLGGIAVVTGYLDRRTGLRPRLGLPAGAPVDAAALLHGGAVAVTSAKHHLPNYGVFDEYRYFVPGDSMPVFRLPLAGQDPVDVAIAICEDLWQDGGPVAVTRVAGAALLVVPNASPYERGKDDTRLDLCQRRAREAAAVLAYVNMVGGQDELVFDGDSIIVDASGALLARGPQFDEALVVADLALPAADPARPATGASPVDAQDGTVITLQRLTLPPLPARPSATAARSTPAPPVPAPKPTSSQRSPAAEVATKDLDAFSAISTEKSSRSSEQYRPTPSSGDVTGGSGCSDASLSEISAPRQFWPRLAELAEVYAALVTGVRDYVHKNGFASAIVGLSGGIDSALTATIAADAIGPDRVHVVLMPSRYSSDHSVGDAEDLAKRQGLHARTVPIQAMVEAYDRELGLTGLAEENLQSRIRGVILMGLSNAEGHLVLTTGNKSELATGYSTLYGDSAGGYAPIKDVPKTLVWELARWRNQQSQDRGEIPPIPENSITKPPSAELAPGQLDSDLLPDYTVLDALLDDYVEQDMGTAALVAAGHDPVLVEQVIRMVDRAEYKRRQYPPGPKISAKNFGRDRRLPITSKWREPLRSAD